MIIPIPQTYKEEKRIAIIAFLLLVAALTIGLSPLLSGERVIYEEDVMLYYLPAFKFYAEMIITNQPALIAPIFSGFPLHLTQAGGFLDPIHVPLFKTFSFLTAYHLRIFLNYVLAGLFAYLFARSIKLSALAASVVMFSFVTAQHLMPEANILRSNSIFLMPALFYIIHELHRCATENQLQRGVLYTVLGIGIIVITFLGGYTQLNLYGLVASIFFVAYLFWNDRSWYFLTFVGGMFTTALAILTPYILAVLDLVSISGRVGGLSWVDASASVDIRSYLANLTTHLLLPPFRTGTLQSLYIGTISIFFCIAGILASRRNQLPLFFVGLFAFSIISAFPYPLFFLMYQLPVFELFRFPPHWFFVSSFAMSVLAGLGVVYFQNNTTAGWRAKVQKFLSNKVNNIVLLFILALNVALPMRMTIAEHSISSTNLIRVPWIVEIIEEQDSGTDIFRTYQLYPADVEWFTFIKKFDPPPQARNDFNREYTQSHLTSLLWGVETVRGFDNLVPRRYQRVLEYLERGGALGTFNDKTKAFTMPDGVFDILGMMNVKYVWTYASLADMHKRDVTLLETGYPALGDVPFRLYQNKRFLPRVFVPPYITILPEEESGAFSTIIERENDFATTGFIECDICERVKFAPQKNVAIRDVKVSHTRVTFTAESGQDAWVIVSNSHLPGWKVFVDDTETKLYYANYLYQGVHILKGGHSIVLEYSSPYSLR